MSLAIGMVALAVLGAEPRHGDSSWIGYTVRTVETPAIAWRKQHLLHLKSMGHQGASQVWTAPAHAVDALVKESRSGLLAPRVAAASGATMIIDTQVSKFYIDVTRVGDAQTETTQGIAYRAAPGRIEEGYRTMLSGRNVSDGILTKVDIAGNWFGGVVKIPVGGESNGTDKVGVVADLPLSVSTNLSGEWSIPTGQALILSLGTQTLTDTGSATPQLMERLTIIEAKAVQGPGGPTEPSVVRTGFEATPVTTHAEPSTQPAAKIALRAMPPLPSRSPVSTLDRNGRAGSSAALPDPHVAPASLAGPPAPRPTPQSVASTASLQYDPSVAQARFEPMPIARSGFGVTFGVPPLPAPKTQTAITTTPAIKYDPSVAQARYEPMPIAPSGFDFALDMPDLATGRSQTVRIPLGGSLAIEIKAHLIRAEPTK